MDEVRRHSHNVFFVETFMSELADGPAPINPFRLGHIKEDRVKRVLELAQKQVDGMEGWAKMGGPMDLSA